MPDNHWVAVDDFINATAVRPDDVLEGALLAASAAGMPAIAVSAAQGKMLAILARAVGAEKILEIGTLGAYSTIWMARTLPRGGRLISLEIDPRHAEVARKNIAAAGLEGVAEVRVGAALDTLPDLEAENAGPFDLFFIDADKANIPAYFEWSLRLARPGSLIVVDNVVRNGGLADASSDDPSILGVRLLHDLLGRLDDSKASATTIQTVGAKGYDGFTLAVVGA